MLDRSIHLGAAEPRLLRQFAQRLLERRYIKLIGARREVDSTSSLRVFFRRISMMPAPQLGMAR